MQGHNNEEEDLDCVILMSYHHGNNNNVKPEGKTKVDTFHFYYAMGFLEETSMIGDGVSVKQITGPKQQAARAIILREGATCDLFLCANVSASFVRGEGGGWTEAEWETFVAKYVDNGVVMRVQTACTVTADNDGGAACLDRLIEKDMMTHFKRHPPSSLEVVIEVNTDLLNCYRSASGGRMHPLDRRPWLMSVLITAQMQFEVQTALDRIMQLTIQGSEVHADITLLLLFVLIKLLWFVLIKRCRLSCCGSF
jgi:hypothetical protein